MAVVCMRTTFRPEICFGQVPLIFGAPLRGDVDFHIMFYPVLMCSTIHTLYDYNLEAEFLIRMSLLHSLERVFCSYSL